MKATSRRPKTALVVLGALLALSALVGTLIVGYPIAYDSRIVPGVEVHGVDLGGLTAEEAEALLTKELPLSPARSVDLHLDSQTWEIAWAEMGLTYDWAGTAQAAFRIARSGPLYRRGLSGWRVRLRGRTIEPRVSPADPGRIQLVLGEVARTIAVSPTEAVLEIDSSGVTCEPGRPGRALQVAETTEAILMALAGGATEVDARVSVVRPKLAEPEPGCSQAQDLLSQPFTLTVDDILTDYRAHLQITPQQLARSLHTTITETQIRLDLDEAAVQGWLRDLAPQIGGDLVLDVEETAARTVSALKSGDHGAKAAIRHPESTYVVEPGDTLFDIAYAHGFPVWRLEEANPNVEPGELLIGMELTIPSIDVLFPEPLVPGKRIDIDLPEQRLRAYENDEIVYDLACSSGMTTTPTIAGQFQVLFKEPEAFASRWDLEMPYFMAIYYEGPDFANGIHELPIHSNGQRLWASILGWPASYGCIILDVGDAEKLYDWAPVGTLVRITGVAPGTYPLP